jgi:hypothetical protein
LRSDTKAPPNSIANIAASSANHLSEIFGPFARQALRPWSQSVISKAPSDPVVNKRKTQKAPV